MKHIDDVMKDITKGCKTIIMRQARKTVTCKLEGDQIGVEYSDCPEPCAYVIRYMSGEEAASAFEVLVYFHLENNKKILSIGVA